MHMTLADTKFQREKLAAANALGLAQCRALLYEFLRGELSQQAATKLLDRTSHSQISQALSLPEDIEPIDWETSLTLAEINRLKGHDT